MDAYVSSDLLFLIGFFYIDSCTVSVTPGCIRSHRFGFDKHLASLKSKEDWDQRSATIRDSFVAWAGPFPEKNPLNARITGTVRREGYVIQNVVFESRPNYLVSANLYLPSDMESPGPALLNVIGHATQGKADPRYQHMSANMARKGFVVLTMDGIGQGERRIDSYQGAGNRQAWPIGF